MHPYLSNHETVLLSETSRKSNFPEMDLSVRVSLDLWNLSTRIRLDEYDVYPFYSECLSFNERVPVFTVNPCVQSDD